MTMARKLDRRTNVLRMRVTAHDLAQLDELRVHFTDKDRGFKPIDADLCRVSWSVALLCVRKWKNGEIVVPPIPRGHDLWRAFESSAGLDKKRRGPAKRAEASQRQGLVPQGRRQGVPPNLAGDL